MELSWLSGIGTLNPTAPSYPDRASQEGTGSSCLFSKCQHCRAHKEALQPGRRPDSPVKSCGSYLPAQEGIAEMWSVAGRRSVPDAAGVLGKAGLLLGVCPSVCLILLLRFLQSSKLPFCPLTMLLCKCQRRIPGAALLLLCPPLRWCGGRGEERDSH